MTPKVLTECDFLGLLAEAVAQTQSGIELIRNYKSYCMNAPVSCGLVNNFIKEAMKMRYDTGVSSVLEQLTDYINCNNISWQLASTCEAIENNASSKNYLNRNAVHQAEKLLEMEEEDVVRYIRSGALKNVMYCEGLRKVANNVFKDTAQVYVQAADYTKITPVSLVENLGDSVAFVVCGRLFIQDNLGQVQESKDWNQVSQTFRIIESLLESNLVTVLENGVEINYNNRKYSILEKGEGFELTCEREGESHTMTISEFREEIAVSMRTINPRRKQEYAQVMESMALLYENFNKVCSLDNVQIFTTSNEKFIVIENNDKLFASGYNWQVNDDAIKVLEFINQKTNVSLDEEYNEAAQKAFDVADAESKAEIKASLQEKQILSIKDRISLLTEKFKNDPAKLAVLSKCASEVAEML